MRSRVRVFPASRVTRRARGNRGRKLGLAKLTGDNQVETTKPNFPANQFHLVPSNCRQSARKDFFYQPSTTSTFSFLSNRSGKINNEPRIFFLLFPTNLHRLRILSFLSSPIISNDWRGLIHIKKDLNPIFNSDEFLNGGQSRKTWMKRRRGKVSLIVEQRQARRANSRQLGDPPEGVFR